MSIGGIRNLYSTKREIGALTAHYSLGKYSEYGHSFYIVTVKYGTSVNSCVIEAGNKDSAERKFSLLVKTKTTPASLSEAICEMC